MAHAHGIIRDYLPFAFDLVAGAIERHGLLLSEHGQSQMGEWYAHYENAEFSLRVSQDRAAFVSIELGSKEQPKQKGHIRGPWSLAHLRGYLECSDDYGQFSSVEEQGLWLAKNQAALFDSALLNSDELREWSKKASRRRFPSAKTK